MENITRQRNVEHKFTENKYVALHVISFGSLSEFTSGPISSRRPKCLI